MPPQSFWRRLSCAYPQLDEQQLFDAWVDAVVECPQLAAETQEEALHRLFASAWRNARDTTKGELARHNRESAWAEERAREASDPGSDVLLHEPMAVAREAIYLLLPDELMRITFRLMLSGERRRAVFAAELGLQFLPDFEQRTRVEHEKDRLRKYLRRNKAIRQIALRALR